MDIKKVEEVAAACTACSLSSGRDKPVFAKGAITAKLMICGMVPAIEENKVGIPFVGRAGKLLDDVLQDVGLSLNDVYITNLVKCFLAAGLPLKQEWIDTCFPFLLAQIALIKPKVIITLGKDATYNLLNLDNKLPLGKVRGKVYDYRDIEVVPAFHPSFILRRGGKVSPDYNTCVQDFNTAITLLNY